MKNNNQKGNTTIITIVSIVSIIVLIVLSMWLLPKYRIYRQDLAGQANLRQQEWEKKILIEGAKAKRDSAVLEAEAEVERAKGVSEANRIIAGSLQGNESYLRYLWIDKIADNPNVIYVPTEASLPILEARNKEIK